MALKLRPLLAFALILTGFLTTIFWHSNGSALPTGPTYRIFDSTASLPQTEFAIATFLTGQGTDAYFVATRMLMYSLLHAPNTKANSSLISVLAICSESVSEEQKIVLQKDGVTVVDVKDVPVSWWIYSGVKRWKEQFTKLRVFEMIEYKRILFIDADTLITRPLDTIFSSPEVTTLAPRIRDDKLKKDESSLPKEWFFAARSDSGRAGEENHPIPPFQTTFFSAGFFMLAPDPQIYTHLLSVMSHWWRFDPFTMEQSLLNYVFRREATMPWRELDWRWSATWPTEGDLQAGVASLHEKLWDRGPEVLQQMWKDREQEMRAFYDSER